MCYFLFKNSQDAEAILNRRKIVSGILDTKGIFLNNTSSVSRFAPV